MLGTFDEFMRRVGFAICALVFPILCYISCTKKTKPRAVESFYDVTASVSNPHAGDANKAATGNKAQLADADKVEKLPSDTKSTPDTPAANQGPAEQKGGSDKDKKAPASGGNYEPLCDLNDAKA